MIPFPRRSKILVLLLGVAACGGASSPSTRPRAVGGPTAAGERTPVVSSRIALTTSWQSEALFQRRDSLVLTLPDGTKQVQLIGQSLQLTLNLNRGVFTARLDSMTLRPEAPELAKAAIGTVWTGKIGAYGRLEDLSPSRSGILVEELTNSVAMLVPRLPRGGASTGERWSDTTERTIRVQVFRTQEHRETEWLALAAIDGGGIRVVPIQVRERFEQIGKGVSANRAMQMTAQGSRSGTYYLTSDGRVDRAEMTDSIAKLITIPESKQSIPTMQYSQTVIRYRPIRRP